MQNVTFYALTCVLSQQWLSLHAHETAAECTQALRNISPQCRIICAKPEAPGRDTLRGMPTPLQEIDFGQETALVFGNEHSGVSNAM